MHAQLLQGPRETHGICHATIAITANGATIASLPMHRAPAWARFRARTIAWPQSVAPKNRAPRSTDELLHQHLICNSCGSNYCMASEHTGPLGDSKHAEPRVAGRWRARRAKRRTLAIKSLLLMCSNTAPRPLLYQPTRTPEPLWSHTQHPRIPSGRSHTSGFRNLDQAIRHQDWFSPKEPPA